MIRPTPELVIFIFGILSVLAALEHLPNLKYKGWLLRILFAVGIITQLSTHYFQFSFASKNKEDGAKETEAATAIALYAYTENDIQLLRDTSKDSYLVGYRLFKNGDAEGAEPFFRQALYENKFVASSYFILAHITTHDACGRLDRSKDWASAFEFLEKSIANNQEYAPSHYLLAELYANTHRIESALKSLPNAVLTAKFGRVPCRNINAPWNIEHEWGPIKDNPEFIKIQQQCKRFHGIQQVTQDVRASNCG
jgi:tetratricopeptide (TPR) repeat protein